MRKNISLTFCGRKRTVQIETWNNLHRKTLYPTICCNNCHSLRNFGGKEDNKKCCDRRKRQHKQQNLNDCINDLMIHRIISHLVLFLVCTAQSADSDTTKESVFDNAMDMASTSNHQFATNSALFALDLYGILKRDRTDQNIIFSPISIQTCGALARIGAEGKTAEELDKGLRLISSDITAIAQSFHSLLNKYAKSDVLKIINRIYVMDGFQITNDFKSIANTSFFADAEEINFENNLSAAIRINEWVESKTKNLIKNLVSPNSLNNYTRMLLLNAVYFKGKWLNSFDQQSTRTENFYLNNQDAIQVSMMFTEGRFSFAYLSELNAAVIEMPYEDGDLSMLVILPDSRTGLENLENKLLTKSLSDITADMVSSKVRIKFPKFKAEFSVELKEAMEKLGMRRLFAEHAELGKMLKNSQMGVSEVVHKAYIVVNEEGTEAAAATAMNIRTKRALNASPEHQEFIADHPFFYVIHSTPKSSDASHRNKLNKTILFIGSFCKPTPDQASILPRDEL